MNEWAKEVKIKRLTSADIFVFFPLNLPTNEYKY
jgi:hypothetical protein